jgi:hypothetical protein
MALGDQIRSTQHGPRWCLLLLTATANLQMSPSPAKLDDGVLVSQRPNDTNLFGQIPDVAALATSTSLGIPYAEVWHVEAGRLAFTISVYRVGANWSQRFLTSQTDVLRAFAGVITTRSSHLQAVFMSGCRALSSTLAHIGIHGRRMGQGEEVQRQFTRLSPILFMDWR